MITNYFKLIKEIISEKTGLETSEIKVESHFEDDLNIGELEFVEIIGEIEEKLHIDLTEEKENTETVAGLIEAIKEQIE